MAVKWAIVNGNWNAGATWNGGTIPAADDDVFFNGYRVTANVDVIAKNISNSANADYSIVAGGYLYIQVSDRYVTANLFADSNEIVRMTLGAGQNVYVIGNVVTPSISTSAFYKTNQEYAISVVGNVLVRNGSAFGSAGNYRINATVVGNITTEGSGNVFGNSFATSSGLVINGNCDLATNIGGTLNSVTINGLLTKRNTVLSSIVNLTIGGDVFYENVNPLLLFKNVTYLSFSNVNSLVIKDITTPRTYPYIILTDAEMNNRQQYPSENEVKEGTEYAWGEKVGTYQQPPEAVVLKDYVYDTITAEENDIATYNLTRYIYADYGTLHWFELKTTTTDIVTTPSQQSIIIDGDTVVADTDYVVEYNDVCYQWSGSAWGNITTKNIGTVKTDIVTNPTETTLCAKKGLLEVVNLPQTTLDRMANALTIDIFQQILDAHLNN